VLGYVTVTCDPRAFQVMTPPLVYKVLLSPYGKDHLVKFQWGVWPFRGQPWEIRAVMTGGVPVDKFSEKKTGLYPFVEWIGGCEVCGKPTRNRMEDYMDRTRAICSVRCLVSVGREGEDVDR